VLVITLAVVILLASAHRFFVLLDNRAYDIRVTLVNRLGWGERATGKVVLVALEESSALAKKPLIFWYPDLGLFFQAMREAGVRAVGVDMIPVHSMGEKLRELLTSLDKVPAAIQKSLLDDIGEAADNALLRPLIDLSETTPVVMATYHANVPYFYGQLPFLKNVSAASATITSDAVDGVFRAQSCFIEPDKPYFVAALYTAAMGTQPPLNEVRADFSRLESIPVMSFDSIMDGSADRKLLRDKIVILGFLSSGDRHSTAIANFQHGSMIHAVTLDTLLAGKYLKDLPALIQWLLLFSLALFGTLIGYFLRPSVAFSLSILVAMAYFCAATAVMASGRIVTVFPHMLAPFFALMVTYPYRYLYEERVKRKVYKVFNYYLDQQVIDELVTGDVGNLLRGERKNVTVMFIDIRNFTAMSQKVPPEAVVSLLNSFFGDATEIIQSHNGIVNKFIGDGVMAFFPLHETSGIDAVHASLDVIKAAHEVGMTVMTMDAGFPEGMSEFAIGIGLHYGEVIMGNIGSERKMDFTVMGPTVNLASRIEGLTKEFGCELLLSESVHEIVQCTFQCRLMGEAHVKGVSEAVKVYSITSKES
jgi:class 3 adenylate cyclase/CHASE2 domain-containing sensor protein